MKIELGCGASGLALALTLAASAQAGPTTKKSPRAAPTPAQATGERAVQASLPQSKAPVWAVLRKTRIGEDGAKGVFTAAFPPEVKAMDKQTVSVSGFMLPLDAQPRSKHFLLSKYTPVCFFCPPGEPNEVVEVMSKSGVAVTDRMLNVTGRFALTNDGEKGLFFRLDQAEVR
ncbi:hypothetical protein BH09PSE2_BH09PSE2_18000 [soil metagenome]